MTEFRIGDQVRMRDLPAVGSYAGQGGVVIGLSRTSAGTLDGYHVKLVVDLSDNRPDTVGVSFAPQELEFAPEEDNA